MDNELKYVSLSENDGEQRLAIQLSLQGQTFGCGICLKRGMDVEAALFRLQMLVDGLKRYVKIDPADSTTGECC